MANFSEVAKEYLEIYRQINLSGKFYDSSNARVWAPANISDLEKIFAKFKNKKKKLADLGSGDGLVVNLASFFFLESTGIEIDEKLSQKGARIALKFGLKNVRIIKQNYLDCKLSDYDILFIAPDKPFDLKLENKLKKELKAILIVYSAIFQPKTLRKVDEIKFVGNYAGIYSNRL